MTDTRTRDQVYLDNLDRWERVSGVSVPAKISAAVVGAATMRGEQTKNLIEGGSMGNPLDANALGLIAFSSTAFMAGVRYGMVRAAFEGSRKPSAWEKIKRVFRGGVR